MNNDKVEYKPYVPATMEMREFTVRALLLGLIMTVVLGAANAYLGLRAGITIAATYPAAVIGMAALRLMRGSILEENIARTAGSIGESVAAGAIFTIPAFVISRAWLDFSGWDAYWKSTVLMLVGSIIGVLFISLVRRGMVEDKELQFPESLAASEIHKAGRRGAEAVRFLLYNIGIGGGVFLLSRLGAFAYEKSVPLNIGQLGTSTVRLSATDSARVVNAGGITDLHLPEIAPAYIGVGYIIGIKLAALQFSGGVLAWGLLVPLLIYLMGPNLGQFIQNDDPGASWSRLSGEVWRFIVRPIAVGGMMVGAAYTLFKMRKSIATGLSRGFAELRGTAPAPETLGRTERYMSFKTVFALIALMFIVMIGLYTFFAGDFVSGLVAAIVMLIVGFFFATVSGSLVGMIGSSNNPISGLTLSTLIIAALLMVALGASGAAGVAVVLGVAAVVCVSSAVAGELLQDFKVGYILGGTPRTIQVVELIAVVVASLVMYFPLWLLHEGNIRQGGTGFGHSALSAPQAGLMAMLADGIVGGQMAWPLVILGMCLGVVAIMCQVRSPMLLAVGMYLPFQTTAAIFVGGVIRWIADTLAARRGFNEAQRARIDNAGALTASGLIAGEALLGLVWSGMQFLPPGSVPNFGVHSYAVGLVFLLGLAAVLIWMPLSNAGRPDEPAPPTAIM